MKKASVILALCAALAVPAFAAEEIEWDFSKGIKPNGPFEFVLSKKATTEDGYLYIKDPLGMTCGGAVFAKNKYPELSPKGAFRMSFVLSFEKPRSEQPFMMIWDSKGDYYEKKTGKPIDNSGFTIAIYRPKGSKTVAVFAWLGNGTKTSAIKGTRFPVELGKKYNLHFDYDGKSKYSILLDDKNVGTGTVTPGGPIAPAFYKPTIGNRSVGNYFPFDGKIYSVKMIKK